MLQNETDAVHLFDGINIYADLATCHQWKEDVYMQMCKDIEDAGCIPKIQLHSPTTFNRKWTLPKGFVPSVFRPSDVEWVMQYHPRALKVASVEATYDRLISACVETKLPLIISTGGMDIDELVHLLGMVEERSGEVCLMHCVSMYPTPYEHARMCRISMLADAMEDMLMEPCVGWSSHHYDRITSKLLPVAIAYGAEQIEVHVRPDSDNEPTTADEKSAVPTGWLAMLREKAEFASVAIGDCEDEEAGPDRVAVLEWRQRWESGQADQS